jgi:hypothetical protein
MARAEAAASDYGKYIPQDKAIPLSDLPPRIQRQIEEVYLTRIAVGAGGYRKPPYPEYYAYYADGLMNQSAIMWVKVPEEWRTSTAHLPTSPPDPKNDPFFEQLRTIKKRYRAHMARTLLEPLMKQEAASPNWFDQETERIHRNQQLMDMKASGFQHLRDLLGQGLPPKPEAHKELIKEFEDERRWQEMIARREGRETPDDRVLYVSRTADGEMVWSRDPPHPDGVKKWSLEPLPPNDDDDDN